MNRAAAELRLESLRASHQSLELELHQLNRRAYLTPAEQQRTRIIKKEKLRMKDNIRLLIGEVALK